MNLSRVAGAALAGLTYVFAVKSIDTLWHGIFEPSALTATVAGLNILAGLTQLNFYIHLLRCLAPPGRPGLRLAAWSGIAGSTIGLLPKLLAIAALHQNPSLFFFLKQGQAIAAFGPWLAAVLLFICCIVFFLESRPGREPPLRWAFGVGAAGYLVMALVLSAVLVNFLAGSRTIWSAGQVATGLTLFIATAAFTYLAVAYFYVALIRRR